LPQVAPSCPKPKLPVTDRIIIQNRKYFKPFDGTDNPCCWMADLVSVDLEKILRDSIGEFDSMFEDWGIAHSWKNQNGIVHSLQISCIDLEAPRFEITLHVEKKRLLLFPKKMPIAHSDFPEIITSLKNLSE
jgi:hypothetical protein